MTSPLLSVSTPNGRFYQHPVIEDSFVPSITNITGMKDKPALKNWAAKMAATCAVEDIDIIKAMLEKENGEKMAIDHIKGAPWRNSSTAASRGDVVHDWVDLFIKNELQFTGNEIHTVFTPEPADLEKAGPTARGMWKQFRAFDDHYSPTYLASEFTVWSETHGYAGTGDLIAIIRGKTVYIDTKTGNGVYPEVGMQVSAQMFADYYFDNEGNQQELPKPDAGAVFHLRPRFSRLSPLRNLDQAFRAFLGLRACFEWDAQWAEATIAPAPQVKAT